MRCQEGPAKLASQMYYGGCQLKNVQNVLLKDRPLDVVFCATNYGFPYRSWRNEDSKFYGLRKLLDDVADDLIFSPHRTIFDAFKNVLKKRGMEDENAMKLCLPLFSLMYFYLRTYRRIKCIEMMAKSKIKIDVYGGNWNKVPFADKLNIHGAIDYSQSLEVYSNAKIVLNECATFDDGIHDRVFSAMLNGAAVVSDYSTCFDKEFVIGEEIETYEWNKIEEMPNIVASMLFDDKKRQWMIEKAHERASRNYTWANRAMQIVEIVTLYRVSNNMI